MSIQFVDLKAQYKALKPNIDARIQKVLDHGGYINGPEVAELELKLAEFTGSKYALTCASGTDALVIPMMAKGIGPGDEVITTAFSFIASAETVALVGAKPVYADIDPKTFNIDVKDIERLITKKTKAIVPVSLYGQVADMDEINALAKKHNLLVIEDSAQSFGATYKDRRSCNVSEIGGTSFFPAKPLGCYGDGGAIFTNDANLLKVMKEIREHGSETRYFHTRLGLNGRLDTIQCAILLAKLERYPWEIEQRERVAQRYTQAFSEIKIAGFTTPYVKPGNKSVWAQYSLRVPNRAAFQKKLTDAGVPTSIHYPRIMPDQPWYKENTMGGYADGSPCHWTESRKAAEEVISIPMYPDMDNSTQDLIINAVRGALK